MITLFVNYTLNGKSYNSKIFTKNSFSIDSIKRDICLSLTCDKLHLDESECENIVEDVQQLIMNNIIIQSIEIKHIKIDENYSIKTTIEKDILDELSNKNIITINN